MNLPCNHNCLFPYNTDVPAPLVAMTTLFLPNGYILTILVKERMIFEGRIQRKYCMQWKDATEVLHAMEGCNGSIACNGRMQRKYCMQWKDAMEDGVLMKLNYMTLMGFRNVVYVCSFQEGYYSLNNLRTCMYTHSNNCSFVVNPQSCLVTCNKVPSKMGMYLISTHFSFSAYGFT